MPADWASPFRRWASFFVRKQWAGFYAAAACGSEMVQQPTGSGTHAFSAHFSFLTARPVSTSQIAVNLSTLAELARIDKRQWLNFAREYHLPIETRPRDAARDILGKVLVYLES